ncbi:MAG TPA: GNAT family N-acetyltransferase [Microscillaceae bacterium]|nr:GNAT family N-acetyltransferase [Microscillaceae bacterium]
MATTITRTDSRNDDFKALIDLLDVDLRSRYGPIQDHYDQFNDISVIPYVVVAYVDNEAIGCGAFKQYDDTQVEIKRVFVKESSRGKGVARLILAELEGWAKELGFAACVLETGDRQYEAIDLYNKKLGYEIIPNYGQYAGLEHSVCMRKAL